MTTFNFANPKQKFCFSYACAAICWMNYRTFATGSYHLKKQCLFKPFETTFDQFSFEKQSKEEWNENENI